MKPQKKSKDPATTATRKSMRIANLKKNKSTILAEKLRLANEILTKNVCRVCSIYLPASGSASSRVPLYEKYKGVTLSMAIISLMLMQVDKNDGKSEVVCKKCAKLIVDWHNMRRDSSESARLLQIEAQRLGMSVVNTNERGVLTYYMVNQTRSDNVVDPVHPRIPAMGHVTEVVYYGRVRDGSQMMLQLNN